VLYNISHSQQWSELQRFLVPKLTQLRALCQTQSIQKPGTGAAGCSISRCSQRRRSCLGAVIWRACRVSQQLTAHD
jgi:hypothetical protein